MKNLKTIIFTLSIVPLLIINSVNADCSYPKKDFVVPQGSNSTEAEMVEVMNKVKTYQTALGSYRACIDDELKLISPELENYAEIYDMQTKIYNASVEEEENLAEEWGAAVKAFKSQ